MNAKHTPTVIFLYGPVAVGKYTIGKVLSEALEFSFAHNHLVNDMVEQVYSRDSDYFFDIAEHMRLELHKQLIGCGINFVTTYCFSYSFVDPSTNTSDIEYVFRQKKQLEDLGARVCFVYLSASHEVLMNRVGGEERKNYGKLTDPNAFRKLLDTEDWYTSASVEGELAIDTTEITPEQTTQAIIDHFNLM